MTFLMISTFYPPYSFGGDAVFLHRLCNQLAQDGHYVHVFHCMDAYRLLAGNAAPEPCRNHANVTVHPFQSGVGSLSPLLTQQTGRAAFKGAYIRKLLQEHDIDVIHYHNMSLIGVTALRIGEAVKFYTMHEHWLICPMHILWKYNSRVCSRRNCISCQLVGRRPVQWWRYTALLKRHLAAVDMFISPGRFTMSKHSEFGLDLPMVHLPYFLSENQPASQSGLDQQLTRHGPYFLFAGRLEKIKGLQDVIPVFRDHAQYTLLVAGSGSYESELRKHAAGAANIVFLGRIPFDRLAAYYAAAIATIVPSVCYEVFPMILVESFARRTPVIVNNLGSLPEIVAESRGGLTYHSPAELAACLVLLHSDPAKRDQLGRNGYQCYCERWSPEPHMTQYFNLIDQAKTTHHV